MCKPEWQVASTQGIRHMRTHLVAMFRCQYLSLFALRAQMPAERPISDEVEKVVEKEIVCHGYNS